MLKKTSILSFAFLFFYPFDRMDIKESDVWEWLDTDAELCSFSSFTYTHDNNKRAPCNATTNNTTSNFVNRFQIFHLPLFLTEHVWKRHDYSTNDIQMTLNDFKSSYHLWCLALQQNLSIANSAVVSTHF